MANNVARLGVVLGLNTAEFIAGIENASKKLDRFAKSIDQYAKYGATALAAMSVAALKFADDIADVADANEVAIDTVVKLRMALDASGGSADKAGVMLSAFTKFIDTAADGSFEAQKAFKSVGVSLKDIGSMTQEQLLSKVLSGLEQMEDTVTRNARAMDFFSKAAKGVAFDKFAQEMSNTTALTREQIEAVKAGAETWDNLQKIISKVQLLFVNALGPSLKAINSTITDETFPKIQMLGTAFNFLASNIHSAYKAMQSVAILLEKIAGYSVIMQTYGESNEGSAQLKKLDEETNRRLAEIRNQQAEFDRILEGGRKGFPTGVYPKWGKPEDSGGGVKDLRPTTVGVDTKAKTAEAEAKRKLEEQRRYLEQMMKDNDAALEKSRTFTEQMMKDNDDALEKRKTFTEQMMKDNETAAEQRYQASLKEMDAQIKIMQIEEQHQSVLESNVLAYRESERMQNKQLDNERELFLVGTKYKDLKSYELQYAKNVVAIRQKYAQQEYEINMLANEQKLSRNEESIAIERNNELRQKSINQAREVLDVSRKETEGYFNEGIAKGFQEYVRSIPTELQMGQQAFMSVMGNMDMALQDFVRSGKFSFKDFARSVIQDLVLIQMRMQMMGLMKMAYNFMGIGSDVDMGVGSSGNQFARAEGGPVASNTSYLVGERGPEMFVPNSSGTIIPTNNLASAMGGGGQTVNYNGPYIASMNAIDTQTGVQFLAKNKQTIWASYQSANRSVPVSR